MICQTEIIIKCDKLTLVIEYCIFWPATSNMNKYEIVARSLWHSVSIVIFSSLDLSYYFYGLFILDDLFCAQRFPDLLLAMQWTDLCHVTIKNFGKRISWFMWANIFFLCHSSVIIDCYNDKNMTFSSKMIAGSSTVTTETSILLKTFEHLVKENITLTKYVKLLTKSLEFELGCQFNSGLISKLGLFKCFRWSTTWCTT